MKRTMKRMQASRRPVWLPFALLLPLLPAQAPSPRVHVEFSSLC